MQTETTGKQAHNTTAWQVGWASWLALVSNIAEQHAENMFHMEAVLGKYEGPHNTVTVVQISKPTPKSWRRSACASPKCL